VSRGQQEALRACPSCATPLDSTKSLGLRDFRWLGDALPGRVGGSDLDMVLEQSKTGRVLIFEFKPERANLPLGQRLLLKRFVQLGCDVWVVWELGDGEFVEAGAMDDAGNVPFIERMSLGRFKTKVGAWWAAGFPPDRGQQ
jgi:hypothetical protein